MSILDPDRPRRAHAPPGWAFHHPSHGTCVPSCSSFGRCHCGCGERPKISQATVDEQARVKGRPFTFVSGHQARVKHPRAGIWSRNGVPIETVRPLLLWLRERHGTMRTVAELLAIPEATVRGYVYNRKRKRVPPRTARRIADLVLAHRSRGGPLDRWEEQPGLREPPTLGKRRLRSRRS
ncbi:MAG TPA: hypothetical protein VEC15_12955 [Actinomycetota bacterium]|nr:hypothetical protein [Actinomycetota bacterium]